MPTVKQSRDRYFSLSYDGSVNYATYCGSVSYIQCNQCVGNIDSEIETTYRRITGMEQREPRRYYSTGDILQLLVDPNLFASIPSSPVKFTWTHVVSETTLSKPINEVDSMAVDKSLEIQIAKLYHLFQYFAHETPQTFSMTRLLFGHDVKAAILDLIHLRSLRLFYGLLYVYYSELLNTRTAVSIAKLWDLVTDLMVPMGKPMAIFNLNWMHISDPINFPTIVSLPNKTVAFWCADKVVLFRKTNKPSTDTSEDWQTARNYMASYPRNDEFFGSTLYYTTAMSFTETSQRASVFIQHPLSSDCILAVFYAKCDMYHSDNRALHIGKYSLSEIQCTNSTVLPTLCISLEHVEVGNELFPGPMGPVLIFKADISGRIYLIAKWYLQVREWGEV
ncbi:uncharacterized protein DEA37_0014294 [Paragonimus westermani]|uniref:Uncharacterized protein n=1 Tax=Paragonimus westermani TaxID=34504 RepID=A0A5J4NB22_9TREM|nr:uncharacterized protein DEA37_0014294 [Paragonimus westermani]